MAEKLPEPPRYIILSTATGCQVLRFTGSTADGCYWYQEYAETHTGTAAVTVVQALDALAEQNGRD